MWYPFPPSSFQPIFVGNRMPIKRRRRSHLEKKPRRFRRFRRLEAHHQGEREGERKTEREREGSIKHTSRNEGFLQENRWWMKGGEEERKGREDWKRERGDMKPEC